tara:strand:- start:92 stop:430 length:339 start_codon:yes stop_codon:yes gene_type:complete
MKYTNIHKEVAEKLNSLWKAQYRIIEKSDYTVTYTDEIIDDITGGLFEDLICTTDDSYDGEYCLVDYNFSFHDLKGKTYKEIIFYLMGCYGCYRSEMSDTESQMAEQNSHIM